MVAGTKRGLLYLGLHSFCVYLLGAIFTALFVEFYIHKCLLTTKIKPSKSKGGVGLLTAHFSKWGLALFAVSQIACAVAVVLHKLNVLTSLSVSLGIRRQTWVRRALPDEYQLVLLFAFSWWLIRFPLLPSALTFTLVHAMTSAVSERCVAFTALSAREMALQRPREGEWIGVVHKAAVTAAGGVLFLAALLYDGASPRSGALARFHWFLLLLSMLSFLVFGGLQHLREYGRDAEAVLFTREDTEGSVVPPRSSYALPETSGAGFGGFALQTCQRRAMKALLAVRALHCYAHTVVLYLFHFLLTLGCGLQLSSPAARAALVAVVSAASAALSPTGAAFCCTALTKKSSVLIGVALSASAGFLSLVAAYYTREGAASATKAKISGAEDVSAAGAVWCTVLLVLHRVLLDFIRDLLDLAQEDVVEEDAVLFGRASAMASWTRRLCSVCTAPTQALSLIASLFFLAVFGGLRAVRVAASGEAETMLQNTTIGAAASVVSNAAVRPTTATTVLPGANVGAAVAWYVVASSSTVLTLLGLHTFVVSVSMLVIWHRFYNLEGKHLQFVQMATRKRKDEQSVALV